MAIVFTDGNVGQAVPRSVNADDSLRGDRRVQRVREEVGALALRGDAEAEAVDALLASSRLVVEMSDWANIFNRSSGNNQDGVGRHEVRSHAVDDFARVRAGVDWLNVGAGERSEAVDAGGFTLLWDVSPVETPDDQRNRVAGGAAGDVEHKAGLETDGWRRRRDDGWSKASDLVGVVPAVGLRVALERLRDALAIRALELVITTRAEGWLR